MSVTLPPSTDQWTFTIQSTATGVSGGLNGQLAEAQAAQNPVRATLYPFSVDPVPIPGFRTVQEGLVPRTVVRSTSLDRLNSVFGAVRMGDGRGFAVAGATEAGPEYPEDMLVTVASGEYTELLSREAPGQLVELEALGLTCRVEEATPANPRVLVQIDLEQKSRG